MSSMRNDSTLSTILFRIEHLFDGQPSNLSSSSQKLLQTNTQNLFNIPPPNIVLPEITLSNDIVDDFDRYLTNVDHFSDSSHASSPSIPSSSVPMPLTQHNSSQFEFILNALTSSSARINEETTTYLNQGQPYEIKFRINTNNSDNFLQTTTYRSILRLCFWDKTIQNQEQDLMQKWVSEYKLSSLFDIDMNLTYGVLSIIRSKQIPNAVEIVWDTSTTTTSLFIRFKCTSTDFSQKRHGGEKGIPLRIQIDTYHENDVDDLRHLHSCCCKIQLFRLKGAQRKNKADQIRIDKLNLDQRRRYQTTVDHTILQPCIISPLYTLNLLSLSYPPDDLSDVYTPSTITTENFIVPKKDHDIIQQKRNNSIGSLSSSLPNMRYSFADLENNEPKLVTKITIRSTNEEVLNWLNKNNFSSVLNRFQHYTGIDLLRLTINDIHQICNGDDAISIRLYNQLNETIVPPLKILYIKTTNTDIYSAIYLHTLTRKELEEKLFEFIQHTQQETYNIILELNKIKIKIDNDNVVKYSLPNGGQFYLKTLSCEFILCLINTSV